MSRIPNTAYGHKYHICKEKWHLVWLLQLEDVAGAGLHKEVWRGQTVSHHPHLLALQHQILLCLLLLQMQLLLKLWILAPKLLCRLLVVLLRGARSQIRFVVLFQRTAMLIELQVLLLMLLLLLSHLIFLRV